MDGEISIDELKGVTPEVLARLKEYLKTKNSKGINTETLTKLNTLVLKIESSTPAVSSSDSNSQAPVVGKPELSKHSNESTPVVLNFIRAIELGLIGATPKENLAAFNAMK